MRPSVQPHLRRRSGFALVISLSLMALLLLLSVSLTALIRIETRSADIQMETLRARQNALLAAYVAIGDLQRHTGRDTSISARAALLDSDPTTPEVDGLPHPNWTGVWTRDPADGTAILETWLVSGNRPGASTSPEFNPDATIPADQEPVRLREDPSGAGSPMGELSVPSVSVGETGRYAFAVTGEQEKISLKAARLTASGGEPTPGFLPFRQGIEVLGDPGFDPLAPEMVRVDSPASLGFLPGADPVFIDAYEQALSARSAGLLTNNRDGGLKLDLTSALEGDTPADDVRFVNFADYGIPEDDFTTPSPTWGYLRSYYDLKEDVAPSAPGDPARAVAPRPGTPAAHGVGPTIASFSFGIAVGLRPDNTVEYLWQPRVVLHNPYNVPLAPAEYGIYFFGLTPSERSEVGGADPARYFPLALSEFNPDYWVFGGDPAGNNVRNDYYTRRMSLHFARAFTWGTTLNSPIYRDFYDRTRNGEPASYPDVMEYPPGGPRFLIDAPRIEPGEAILFTPQVNREPYIRAAPFTERLVPGDRFAFFDYETPAELLPSDSPQLDPDRPEPSDPDYMNIGIFLPTGGQVRYIDAVLTTARTRTDNRGNEGPPLYVWPDSGDRSRQLFRRSDLNFLQDDIYHMTARIPYNHPDHYEPPVFSPLIYGNPVPPAAANSVAWHAIAYGPINPAPGITYNPFRYFNPRAKIGEHVDLKTRRAGGRAQRTVVSSPTDNYFFEPFVGTLDAVPLETYGPVNNKVRIGGGLLDPVADTQILYDLPRDQTGLYSLGQLQHVLFSQLANEAGYAVGNSHASPLIPRRQVFVQGAGPLSMQDGPMGGSGQPSVIDYSTIDLSHILNDALWDRTFVSTTSDDARVTAALDGDGTLPNPRLRPIPGATLADLQNAERAAAHLLVDGAFNINSTSVEAWMAFLAGNNGRELDGTALESPFFRFFGGDFGGDPDSPWTGFPEIGLESSDPTDPSPLRRLAEAIVEQVKRRGPFLSLADFVNRRLEDGPLGLSGALQSAIDTSGINDDLVAAAEPVDIDSGEFPFAAPEHFQGETADGISGWLSQADILTAVGPFINNRNDTFTIHAYGRSINPVTGSVSSARLELIVQRMPEYVSEGTDADERPATGSVDDRFGRRYTPVSARWVAADTL